MRLLIFFVVLLGLNSCHYFKVKFKHQDSIEGMDSHINHINQKDTSIQYCVITHGIGRKEYDYSYDLIDGVSKKLLGKKYKHKREVIKIEEIDKVNYLEKHTCTSQNSNNKIIFYSVRWSVFTDSIKDSFIRRENKPDNWTLSKTIKNSVMIEKAGDLFFVQRKEVLDKIFTVYDACFEDIQNANISDAHLTLVSASLGSQVLLRYLNHVNVTDTNSFLLNKFSSKNEDDEFNASWFLFSNQIDLMLEGVHRWGGADDKSFDLDGVNMTVFRNPNDMLCYILPDNTEVISSVKTNIKNVYYYNAPFKNNLLSAHTQTLYLKKMHSALAFGTYNDINGQKNWWFKKTKIK